LFRFARSDAQRTAGDRRRRGERRGARRRHRASGSRGRGRERDARLPLPAEARRETRLSGRRCAAAAHAARSAQVRLQFDRGDGSGALRRRASEIRLDAFASRLAQCSPAYADATLVQRAARYLRRIQQIQACSLHYARASDLKASLPLSFFDDVVDAQAQLLCFKLAQAFNVEHGSPALAQLVALLREWNDDSVAATLASIAAKAQDARTRFRAFELVGDIYGVATPRFIALALDRIDNDPVLKVRQFALERIASVMPSIVDLPHLAELTGPIGKKLCDVATKDSSSKLRAGAVRVLGESFEANRSIVGLVVSRVNDKDAAVRVAASAALKAMPFDVVCRFVSWSDWTQLLACASDSDDSVRAALDGLFVSLLRHHAAQATDRRKALIETLAQLQFCKNDELFGDMIKRHIAVIKSMLGGAPEN
jgi:hypothetical protein